MLDLESFNNQIEQIRTCEDTAERQTLLLNLSNDFKELDGDITARKKELEQVTKERDTYRDTNNQLWLERSTNTSEDDNNTNINKGKEEPPQKMLYSNLKWE